MRRLNLMTAGHPALLGNRDRRKSYYHGKYAKELGRALILLGVIAFCLFRLVS